MTEKKQPGTLEEAMAQLANVVASLGKTVRETRQDHKDLDNRLKDAEDDLRRLKKG